MNVELKELTREVIIQNNTNRNNMAFYIPHDIQVFKKISANDYIKWNKISNNQIKLEIGSQDKALLKQTKIHSNKMGTLISSIHKKTEYETRIKAGYFIKWSYKEKNKIIGEVLVENPQENMVKVSKSKNSLVTFIKKKFANKISFETSFFAKWSYNPLNKEIKIKKVPKKVDKKTTKVIYAAHEFKGIIPKLIEKEAKIKFGNYLVWDFDDNNSLKATIVENKDFISKITTNLKEPSRLSVSIQKEFANKYGLTVDHCLNWNKITDDKVEIEITDKPLPRQTKVVEWYITPTGEFLAINIPASISNEFNLRFTGQQISLTPMSESREIVLQVNPEF